MVNKSTSLTKEQALQKLHHYCAYQERCHSEVRSKLFQLRVASRLHDELISVLIEEDYLDEERFAIAFARGKFKIKNWGKRKIEAALRERQISDYCIRKAIRQIEEANYSEKLKQVARKKYEALSGTSESLRKSKTIGYLISRGFEGKLAAEVVNSF